MIIIAAAARPGSGSSSTGAVPLPKLRHADLGDIDAGDVAVPRLRQIDAQVAVAAAQHQRPQPRLPRLPLLLSRARWQHQSSELGGCGKHRRERC
jgi:hypothetical protein